MRKEDQRLAEDNLNCTFLKDLNKLPIKSYGNNSATLEELLLQFFEFYSLFDFSEKAISINEGVAIRKPNASPLYIVNPLEQTLNVSRNVSYEECERLKMEVRNAAWQLETSKEGSKSNDWGILGLIEKLASRNLKKLIRSGNSNRLLSVKDLFTDKTNEEEVNELRNKIQRLTNAMVVSKNDKIIDSDENEFKWKASETKKGSKKTGSQIKFKNEQVRREVRRIRRNKMI
ncbi:Poly(A) RNA polymerase, mitochondrial [Eumeta japonica]|uniref:Poly(A) RNA polymerase, mitochondrial n=1 Tax=Eumeta variegata TaxID=151549 RepID=A0A4C2A179_EUMVA|nr:Poly(A) RNA polymerase, mitochondrial [Eumeta japonica]